MIIAKCKCRQINPRDLSPTSPWRRLIRAAAAGRLELHSKTIFIFHFHKYLLIASVGKLGSSAICGPCDLDILSCAICVRCQRWGCTSADAEAAAAHPDSCLFFKCASVLWPLAASWRGMGLTGGWGRGPMGNWLCWRRAREYKYSNASPTGQCQPTTTNEGTALDYRGAMELRWMGSWTCAFFKCFSD